MHKRRKRKAEEAWPEILPVPQLMSKKIFTIFLPVKLFLFCHPQLAGYNDEVLDVKFLGPGDSHIVVATNSPQLKVFELATSHCQILYGHTGGCGRLWVGDLQLFLCPAPLATLLWKMESWSSH